MISQLDFGMILILLLIDRPWLQSIWFAYCLCLMYCRRKIMLLITSSTLKTVNKAETRSYRSVNNTWTSTSLLTLLFSIHTTLKDGLFLATTDSFELSNRELNCSLKFEHDFTLDCEQRRFLGGSPSAIWTIFIVT